MGEEVHYFPRALANYQKLKATEIYFHSFGGKEVKKKKIKVPGRIVLSCLSFWWPSAFSDL